MDEARLAQANAENFAKNKAKKYLEHFLTDTRLKEVVPQLLEIFKDEHVKKLMKGGDPLPFALSESNLMETMSYVFGRWIAMSYALGWTDSLESRKLKLVPPPQDDGPLVS